MSGTLPLVGLALLLVGVIAIAGGFSGLQRRRLIEDTPTSRARSVAMGRVELMGRAEPRRAEPVHAPFTGRACVFYECTVEESDHRSREWSVVHHERSRHRFLLRDAAGQVEIDPRGAHIDARFDYVTESGWLHDPPRLVRRALQERGLRYRGAFTNKRMQFRERVILPGQRLYVLGHAGDHPDIPDGSAAEGGQDVLVRAGPNAPFLLSVKSQRALLAALRWHAIAVFAGATLMAGGAFLALGGAA